MLNKKTLEFQFRAGVGEDVSLGGEGGRRQTGVRALVRGKEARTVLTREKVLAWAV